MHPACLPHGGGVTAAPVYFPTWSALQRHARTAHPPACPYVSCAGRTFTQQKGLRAHLKLHEQREAEAAIECVVDASEEEHADINRPRKRRRGGEFGRDWKCDVPGCDKDFKSVRSYARHTLHAPLIKIACPLEKGASHAP